MNTTNRKNFKAFQTPSGIADPVRPNRAPQPYPGASPVKSNAETSGGTLGEMADEMTVTGNSGRVPANMPGKTPGEIPGKMPGKMPVSEPDLASSDSDFKQNPPEKLSKEYANDSANPEVPLDATSKATPIPSQNNLHAGFDNKSENKNEENGKGYKAENQGKPDEEYAEEYDDAYHDDYDDENTEDTYENEYEDEYDDGDEDEEYMENDIHSWFYTFMCMNIPIYGWIYLRRLATGKIPTSLEQQDFAEAYLYYKKFFLKISAVILIVLIIIGAIAINKLLAYMQML